MFEGHARFACGFRIRATPGLHYISWGIASSTLRLPVRLMMKPDLNIADLRIRRNSVNVMTLNLMGGGYRMPVLAMVLRMARDLA